VAFGPTMFLEKDVAKTRHGGKPRKTGVSSHPYYVPWGDKLGCDREDFRNDKKKVGRGIRKRERTTFLGYLSYGGVVMKGKWRSFDRGTAN